ncbi:MAG: IPTL-CTERM sorting domain-containing protein [Phycisphaerae bacterium]
MNGIKTFTAFGLICSAAVAQYEPPGDYYSTVTGNPATLKNELHLIISDNYWTSLTGPGGIFEPDGSGHLGRSYGAARFAAAITDRNPNDSSQIILAYNGASVSATWDSGATWNREHRWPRSWGLGDTSNSNTTNIDANDQHALAPCNPSINSSRGNNSFGTVSSSGGYLLSTPFFYPGDSDVPANNDFGDDTGDVARTMFYMAVRYDGGEAFTVDLELQNGTWSGNNGGDLASLLKWHFDDLPSEHEQRRNHLVFSNTDNPSHYQGNRNPFVDHPEYVWAIWGTSNNDSTLYVGESAPGDGASATSVFFEVIVDGPTPADSITLNKIGDTPTTYNVIVTGDAVSSSEGSGQAFVGGSQSRGLDVSFADTATAGPRSGTITVDNTDLTSAATGQGSADGDDVIDMTADVLDHAQASFSDAADQGTLTIDFGSVLLGAGAQTIAFTIYNLEATAGFTADLDLDSIAGSGDTATLFTDLAAVSDLPAGQGQQFIASFDPAAGEGSYQAVYTISVSDEDLPGAQPGNDMTLTLIGQAEGPIPTLSQWSTVAMALLLITGGTIVYRRRTGFSHRPG